jgi:anti-sigma regulatory factor (Ser/Thr protein kinase)
MTFAVHNPKEKINVYWRRDGQFIEVVIFDQGAGINNIANLSVHFLHYKTA